jgi:hypothetical protein
LFGLVRPGSDTVGFGVRRSNVVGNPDFHRIPVGASFSKPVCSMKNRILAVCIFPGCAYRQAKIPPTVDAERILVAYRSSKGKPELSPAVEGCILTSVAFHSLALGQPRCSPEEGCDVVQGRDPIGPEWLAFSKSWRGSSLAFAYLDLKKACGERNVYGPTPVAVCVEGEYRFVGYRSTPLWEKLQMTAP